MQASLAQALEDMHERLAEAVLGLHQEALYWQPAPGLPAVSELLARVVAEEHHWIAEALAGTPAGGEMDNRDLAEQEGAILSFAWAVPANSARLSFTTWRQASGRWSDGWMAGR